MKTANKEVISADSNNNWKQRYQIAPANSEITVLMKMFTKLRHLLNMH